MFVIEETSVWIPEPAIAVLFLNSELEISAFAPPWI